MYRIRGDCKGFSFIELMIVFMILGILFVVGLRFFDSLEGDKQPDNKSQVSLSVEEDYQTKDSNVVYNKLDIANKLLDDAHSHLGRFRDELMFFTPELPDNLECKVVLNDWGRLEVRVWEKGNPRDRVVIHKEKEE